MTDKNNERILIEELVENVYDFTRTVELLDRFEGLASDDDPIYKRLVIKNFLNSAGLDDRYKKPYFHLVIERGNYSDYMEGMTFTQFKKGAHYNLVCHIKNEVTPKIIEEYMDKKEFYRFSKPFLLRAQNSSNRTGYGWIWDWSDGYGDYFEGTQYGETTNYFFVGTYISSYWEYDPDIRE